MQRPEEIREQDMLISGAKPFWAKRIASSKALMQAFSLHFQGTAEGCISGAT